MNLYPNRQDLVNLVFEQNTNRIKISGFKNSEVKAKLRDFLKKLNDYDFPKHWDRTINIIEDKKPYVAYEILKES